MCVRVCTCVHVCVFNMYYSIVCDQLCSYLSYLCFCFTYLQHISLTFGGH